MRVGVHLTLRDLFLRGAAILLLLTCVSYGTDSSQLFKITYVSSEYVYVDGGIADGLTPGMRLIVSQKTSAVAELEVAFASERSAACRVVNANGEITTGMMAARLAVPVGSTPAATPPTDTAKASVKTPTPLAVARKAMPSISGSISAIVDQSVNRGAFGSDLTQSTARLNLRGRDVATNGLNFSIQLRARRDHRSRTFVNGAPANSWVNRLYEASVTYEAKDAPFNFSFGRIPIRRVGSAGFVDGLLVESRMSGSLRTGLYGGAQSKWQYADQTTSLQKYGAYLNYRHGEFSAGRLDLTLALAGEYHAATANRELIYADGRWDYSDRLNLSTQSEIDLNRGWRRSRVGKILSLSSLYLDSRLKLNNHLSIGLSYDDRKNYWTYDLRSFSDSLFDSRTRQGVRVRLDARLPDGYFTSVTVGQRRTNGDPNRSNSYSLSVNKSAFVIPHSDFSLMYSGFSGTVQTGSNFSARIGNYFRRRDYFGVGYGFYRYRWSSAAPTRTNGWLELTMRLQFLENFFFYGLYQKNSGDDTKGHRIQLEFGHAL